MKSLTRTRKLVLTAIFSLVAIGAASTVIAQSRHNARGHHMTPEQREARAMERLDERLDELDATDTQRAMVYKEVDAFKPRVKALRDAHRGYKHELGEMILVRGELDRERVHGVIDTVSEERTALAHDGLDAGLRVHATFSRDQRDKVTARFTRPIRKIEGSYLIDRGLDRAMDTIDATDVQRAMAEATKKELVATANQLIEDLDPLRALAARELATDSPDAKALHQGLDRASVLLTATSHDVAESLLGFAATLEDSQREVILDKMKARHARHHGSSK